MDKDKFYEVYETIPDSDHIVTVQISMDNHFSKFLQHLIIRRSGIGDIYIDIYAQNDGKFEKVLAHKESAMVYVNDTIRDINGDGFNDFVVNWYGSSGCCLKGFSDTYLLRKDYKTFSKKIEFINPTFDPQNKVIRGVCYGHPGETAMYKYKWHEEQVDTMEYVSYEEKGMGKKTGKIIISNRQPGDDNFKILHVGNTIPKEYRKIEGYDWFTGKGFE